MVTASAVFAPPPLNDVCTVVVLIRAVQASPGVLVCKERYVPYRFIPYKAI